MNALQSGAITVEDRSFVVHIIRVDGMMWISPLAESLFVFICLRIIIHPETELCKSKNTGRDLSRPLF